MTILYKNNAATTVAGGGLATGGVTLTVANGSFIQAVTAPDVLYLTLEDAVNREIIKVTAHTAAAATMTIVRSQDGTADPGTTWADGATVECRIIAGQLASFETLANVDAASSKATPVDGDYVPLKDSASGNALKYLTWANIKATLWAAFGGATSKTTPVDADSLSLYDSAATTTQSRVTWANLKATLVATILTWTAKQIFTGTMKVQQALEKITITAAAPTATQNFDWLTQAIQYFTTAGANNWTLNVRGDSGTTLDSLMAVGESITLTVMATMTGTPYYASAMTIDGGAVTPKWIGGTAPTAGDASCINLYTYTIIKTAAATFTVVASKGKTT